MVLPSFLSSSCANCYYSGEGSRCSLRSSKLFYNSYKLLRVLIYAKPVRTRKCVFKRIILTSTSIAALALAAPALAAPAPALPAASLVVSTAPSRLYSTICRPLSSASHLRNLTEEARALPCCACAARCRDLYLELSALAAANEEEEEEEEKEEEEE
jgi:Protein of unknown function (DUF3716)